MPRDPVLPLEQALSRVLALPRGDQPAAVREELARARSAEDAGEAWNTAFGAASRYEAFTGCAVARGIYAANRATLAPLLASREGWVALEVGGGNGHLWRGWLPTEARGTIVVVDPHPAGADGVRAAVPAGVRVEHLAEGVERAPLPPCDVAVCSLVLHHVAGADAAERASVGLEGPGKHEALVALREALAPRGGALLVNEADVYCDLDLPPGDPVLADRIVDSYVRRFAASLRDDARAALEAGDPERAERLVDVAWAWALGQLSVVDAPVSARDVYELDVPSWLRAFRRAGLTVHDRRGTDRYGLFHRYLCTPGRPEPAPRT